MEWQFLKMTTKYMRWWWLAFTGVTSLGVVHQARTYIMPVAMHIWQWYYAWTEPSVRLSDAISHASFTVLPYLGDGYILERYLCTKVQNRLDVVYIISPRSVYHCPDTLESVKMVCTTCLAYTSQHQEYLGSLSRKASQCWLAAWTCWGFDWLAMEVGCNKAFVTRYFGVFLLGICLSHVLFCKLDMHRSLRLYWIW